MTDATQVRADATWLAGVLTATAAATGVAAVTSSAVGVIVSSLLAVATPALVRAASGGRTLSPAPLIGEARVERTGRRMWAPLWIALAWLVGTYIAFWTTGLAVKVTNVSSLHTFIGSATAGLSLGYALRIKHYPAVFAVPADDADRLPKARRLILASAIYLAVFGIVQMAEYGATDVGSIVGKVQNPGDSYRAKFGVYAIQEATGRVSPLMQLVTLSGVLYGVAGPLLVLYWRRLGLAHRVAGVLGFATFGMYFLVIGTQKGLGDIVVMLLVGVLAGTCGTWWVRNPAVATGRRKTITHTVLAGLAFLGYVISAQSQRAEEFGTRSVTPPNPAVASLIGDKAATGVSAALFYPTHGYLGLSYNLETSFQWTGGLGSSPVVASYAGQYFGTPAPETYPVRTEARTGWPAGMYWATAYPWLASDLTLPGTVLFMVLFGWFFAKMWVEGALRRDTLALIIFGQLAIAVAYLPANNQLGTSRPTAIGFATLLALYAWRSASGDVRRRRPGGRRATGSGSRSIGTLTRR